MKRKILPKQKMSRMPRENGDATTAKIIEAAGRLFAERGYAETTNKDIAKRAKVSLTSINYHFGSREVLYETVIRHVSENILEADFIKRLENNPEPAWDKLNSIIGYITNYEDDEWWVKLWARETVMPSSLWFKMCRDDMIPKLTVILDILSEATGIPKDDPELEVCFVNMLSPSLFILITNHPSLQLHLPQDAFDLAMVSRNIREFVIAGIERTAENYGKRGNSIMPMPV